MGRHRDVSVIANNGTRNYGNLIDATEGCTANVRFDETRDDFNVMQVRKVWVTRGDVKEGSGFERGVGDRLASVM